MEPAFVFYDSLEVRLKTGPDIFDITDGLNRLVTRCRVENGSLFASVIGSTGSLTTIEYEPGVIEDLKKAINGLAPPGQIYAHEEAWHDGNGHSHVQAALIGPSISLPIRQSRLKLGTWQQVVAINHDNKPRSRKIEVTIVGTLRN
ncbi:MAG: secondary thiamine-phosphate synthase enzyme YjbQ [Desulfobacterales bacterium]|nr:secondary thiamine-phosphate synthase enzyme YjbQ [Desulfobacterales bacterium]